MLVFSVLGMLLSVCSARNLGGHPGDNAIGVTSNPIDVWDWVDSNTEVQTFVVDFLDNLRAAIEAGDFDLPQRSEMELHGVSRSQSQDVTTAALGDIALTSTTAAESDDVAAAEHAEIVTSPEKSTTTQIDDVTSMGTTQSSTSLLRTITVQYSPDITIEQGQSPTVRSPRKHNTFDQEALKKLIEELSRTNINNSKVTAQPTTVTSGVRFTDEERELMEVLYSMLNDRANW